MSTDNNDNPTAETLAVEAPSPDAAQTAAPSNQPEPTVDTPTEVQTSAEAPPIADAKKRDPDSIGNRAAPAGHVDDSIGNARPITPSVAETDWDEEETEPGDDIGNRINGPAHHERTTVEAETAAASKRGKGRRKKKGPEGAGPGVRAEGDASGRRGKPRGGPNRDRPAFRVGEEVFGKVVEVGEHAIIIDLSSKAKAIFNRSELSDENLPQVGDHFVANVHGDGSRGGMVVLTQHPERVDGAKQLAQAASESGELVEALVTGVIKGGVELDISGLRAFAPGSHVDLKLGADLHYLVGQRLSFKVVNYAKNGREVVLSRRELLEQQAAENRKAGLSMLDPGSVVSAVVRSVVDWGVFVAIPSANNIEGLIHVTESSHDRSSRLADLFHPGDEVEVKILRIDDKGKLWLSRKAVSGDPWDAAAERFAMGTKHVGRVARMQPFGVFVELAPGIDGLIRTADLSHKRINDPSEVTSVGQEIEVVVVHLDPRQRKIGLHPALAGDTDEPRQRVAMHRSVKVEVIAGEAAGLVVRVLGATGASSRGFIPAGHTGTARGTDLRREFPAGTQLDAKVIEIDNRRGEAKLSIRALKEDSEKAAFSEYRAKVARESKFGTFGDLFAKNRGGN